MSKVCFAPFDGPEQEKIQLAYMHDGAQDSIDGPTGLFWLGGFMSDMEGSKAQLLADLAEKENRPSLRFDYSGHGQSGGKFVDGTISKWLAQSAQLFLDQTQGKRIIVGSSMGGWIATLLYKYIAQHHKDQLHRVAGLVLIAPALDMTKDLMWEEYDEAVRKEITDQGFFSEPSEYGDEPYIITRDLIEDGWQHCLLEKDLKVHCPVTVLQGEGDRDVPWQHGLKVYQAIEGEMVNFNLIKHGDHRLSNPHNLKTIENTCQQLLSFADG